jgi:heparan-alpha-glucosaminide N-acetyltransferase
MSTLSTAGVAQSATPVASSNASRVVSIDIFRGLTIAVMIFVNELAEVRGLPWWTYHAHANQDVMTYVDMVFPFFLFILGMSLPHSVEQRLKRNPSRPLLWMHVMVRSFSLLVLGLILANAEKADRARMGMSGSWWALLGLIGAGLYLNVYPKPRKTYMTALRIIGLLAVVVAFAIFRRTTQDGSAGWIDFSYPEILGLIAFAYFAVALLYIPTCRWRWAAPAWFVLLLSLNVCSTARLVPFLGRLSNYVWPFGNGSHVALVMAGVVTSQIFFGLRPGADERPAAKTASITAVGFALFAFAAGWLCGPLGISKIRATPAWTLWNAGAAVLTFTLLYWICDLWRTTAWAAPVQPAGSNTLLTYLLPDLWYFVLGAVGFTWMETHFSFAWAGVVKSVLFTFLMLGLAWLLTRARVRFQL